MARRESPREDLWAEATALVHRAELQVAGAAEPVVIGFRLHGSASIFFGQNVAYHFNSANELRRAYLDDRLYKADRSRLAVLDRQRTDDAVQLVRHDLNVEETVDFLSALRRRLDDLRTALQGQRVKLLREAPEGAGSLTRIGAWLTTLPAPIVVARHPRVD